MNRGHVTGNKVEKAGSQDWYAEIAEAHAARIEEDERHAAAQALARQIKAEAEAKEASMQLMAPEALCSVNMHFAVAGYGTAQATGRGATPQEAVKNLTGTMAATITALATPEPTPMNRYEKLGRLITCGLQKAQDDPKLTERFLKAVQLVTLGHVTSEPENGMYAVQSQTDETRYYANATRCTCPDRRKHEDEPDYKCKHSLAVCLTAKLEGLA